MEKNGEKKKNEIIQRQQSDHILQRFRKKNYKNNDEKTWERNKDQEDIFYWLKINSHPYKKKWGEGFLQRR